MSVSTYLETHFVAKPTFASMAGMTVERLDALVAAGAIPAASYACDAASIRSAAFGSIETTDAIPGQYFRPECVR